MPIRGAKNPFPAKKKLASGVFTTPQKMDPPPSELAQARKVDKAAMARIDRRSGHGNTGASADAIMKAAMASKRKNPNG